MLYFLLSIVSLLIGPLLYQKVKNQNYLLKFIDGFVFVSISGLLLQHLIPHIYEEAEVSILVLLAIGFLGPNVFEKVLHKAAKSVHTISLLVAILGVLLHTLFDGAALSILINSVEGKNIALAIILHRLPVGLTIWWLVTPAYGKRTALSILVLMIVFTAIGFFGFNFFENFTESEYIHMLEAFVAGTLLHVVFFRIHLDGSCGDKNACCSHDSVVENSEIQKEKGSYYPAPEAIGNLVAVLVLMQLFLHESSHEFEHAHNFLISFLNLSYQTAPALFAAYFLAGIIQSFLPSASFNWLKKGGNIKSAFKGMIFGLPLPICSCGVLPLYKSLVDKKLPAAATLAFLIATPEIGLDAILISLPLLGLEFTIIRLVAAALLAFFVAVFLSKFIKEKKESVSLKVLEDKKTWSEKLKASMKYGMLELVDSTGPWIIIGLFIATIIQPFTNILPFNLPYQLDVGIFSFFGVFTYICATGATPFIAILVAAGMSPGAGLALLLTGPATNISTFGVLSSLHSKKFAVLFAITTMASAILIGVSVNLIFTDISINESLVNPDHFHASIFQEVALIFVVVLFLYSIYRRGLRAFLSEVF